MWVLLRVVILAVEHVGPLDSHQTPLAVAVIVKTLNPVVIEIVGWIHGGVCVVVLLVQAHV